MRLSLSEEELIDALPSSNFKKNGRGDHIISTCPSCSKERHLYINIKTQKWDCKSCGEAGNIIRFLQMVDRKDLLEKVTEPLGKFREIELDIDSNDIETEKGENQISLEDLETKEVKLPILSKSVKEGDAFFNYIRKRGFSQNFIDNENLYWNRTKREWKKRLIIPLFENKMIVGYLGRSIKSSVKPKYRNADGVNFSHLVGNIDELKHKSSALLLEGMFDVFGFKRFRELVPFKENIVPVCTFGKKLSPIQVEKLKMRNVKELIFGYDAEASDVAVELGFRYRSDFDSISYAPIGNSDFDYGDAPINEVFKAIRQRESLDWYSENSVAIKNLD